jgi:2-phosphosulfolactate phosphatase
VPQPSADEKTQSSYEVRFDWGPEGLRSIADGAGVIVVIDTISFTTTVELGVGHGLEIEPFPNVDRSAAEAYAASIGAKVAARRGEPGVSLSPTSMTAENVAAFGAQRAIVVSLNGSRVSSAAAQFDVPVIAANLRNFSAVAAWILDHQHRLGRRAVVAVVAAGERRADDTLRPAVEDQLAAGALIGALAKVGIDACSPEAAVAAASYDALHRAAGHLLTASVSARELASVGQLDDVTIATHADSSTVVPVMRGGVFRAAGAE